MDRHNESLEQRQAEVWVRNNPDLTEATSRPAKTPSPSVCHPDKPRYGNSPFCRRCVDRIRWQGERGKDKLRAEIESNQSLSAAMKADVLERIGSMTEYVRKPEPERRHVDTRKPSVRKHAAKVAILKNLDFDRAAAELKPDLRPHEQTTTRTEGLRLQSFGSLVRSASRQSDRGRKVGSPASIDADRTGEGLSIQG